jgi:hypothetical protein
MTGALKVLAVLLLCAVASFQIALALGAPYGNATMGGRAERVNGVLTARYRMIAAGSAALLLSAAWIVARGATPLRWVVAAVMTVSALASFSAPHRVERWVFGPAAATIAALAAVLAVRS